MLKSSSHKVLPYDVASLAGELANEYITVEDVKTSKSKYLRYFSDYLGIDGLKAKTMVVEFNYISKSYLNDYASYYSLCYKSYARETKRIHFFSSEFSLRTFNSAIKNPKSTSNKIWKNYLGYIVAKPLPDAVIGPTLLKTYENLNDYERFYCARKYHLNIFGKKLEIQSLAFQEQDTIVSACATTAIWSAFHKTVKLFQTPVPTPSEITKSAGNLYFNSGRSFPNHGLDLYQIGKAIESNHLVSELRNNEEQLKNLYWLKSFIYSYLKMGIPVLLGIEIEKIGLHLITLTGYREPTRTPKLDGDIAILASETEKFYAHDDQMGPFSKLEFSGNSSFPILTAWPIKDDFDNRSKARVMSIIVPVHPKIRISYEDVLTKIKLANLLFKNIVSEPNSLYWDIYLDFSNEYKMSIRDSDSTPEGVKKKMLIGILPKHIWVARAYVNKQILLELIFDSTDIARGFYCLALNFYDVSSAKEFSEILKLTNVRNFLNNHLGIDYLNLFDREMKTYNS